MNQNNLGKKLVYFYLFILFPIILQAQVFLKAPDSFYKGDVVQFSIVALGSDIQIPEITSIAGIAVQNTGTSRQTTIVNGSTTYQMTKNYALITNKDVKIPSFEVKIDNKIEKTKEHIIKIKEVTKTKSDLYDLEISLDKDEVYVGQAVVFTLKFKYKKDLEVVSLDYKKPIFDGFWVKELKTSKPASKDNEYVEQEVKYLLFPQKVKDVELGSYRIGVTTLKETSYNRGFFLSSPTVTTPVYSNKVILKVKPLPKGVHLAGDFQISSTIDKQEINQGEAVSYKLKIKGRGNVDDLDEVKLDIPHTTIYDNPSKKEYNLKNNLYGGVYEKSYSILANDDFEIPSVKLEYFDIKTKTVKTIQTKSYKIKVNKTSYNPNQTQNLNENKPKLQMNQKEQSSVAQNIEVLPISQSQKIIFFVLGVIATLGFIGLYQVIKKKRFAKKEDKPLIKIVKNTKTPQELFKVLVIYINIDEELDKIIYKLENMTLDEYKKEKKHILKLLNELAKKDKRLDINL